MQVMRFLFLSCMLWGVLAQAPSTEQTSSSESIFSYLSGESDLSLIVTAISAAGLETKTKNSSQVQTFFVPSNSAFNRLAKDVGAPVEELLADQTQLLEILENHFIPNKVFSGDLKDGDVFTSLAKKTLTVTIENDRTGISTVGSTGYVTKADISVGESVIHIIDEVLLPFKKPELKSVIEVANELAALSNFVEAFNVAGIELPSNLYTIFAPSNAAFEKATQQLGTDLATLLQDDYLVFVILTGHIIPDGRFQSNELFDGQQLFSLEGSPINVSVATDGVLLKGVGTEAGVEQPDVYGQGAVIHVIDNLLLPYVPDDVPASTVDESADMGIVEATPTPVSTPPSIMDVVGAQESCGCTCDENTMKQMMREVMTELLDQYFA